MVHLPNMGICKLALTALTFIALASAQNPNAQPYYGFDRTPVADVPNQTWNISQATNAVDNLGCTSGLRYPSGLNGTYVDYYGAQYAVRCEQDSNGFIFQSLVGTTSQGIYGCFKYCTKKPQCRGFYYQGTVTSGNTGTGRCFLRTGIGNYYSNSTVYGSADLLGYGTPNLPCPYYNGTTYTDASGYLWQTYCGYSVSGGVSLGTGNGDNMSSCMTQCDARADGCNLIAYQYIGTAEQREGQVTNGLCEFKRDDTVWTQQGNGLAFQNAAFRLGRASDFQNFVVSPVYPSATATRPLPYSTTPGCRDLFNRGPVKFCGWQTIQ